MADGNNNSQDIDFDALFADVSPKETVKEVQAESSGVSEAVITEESEDKFVGQVEIKRVDYPDGPVLDPTIDPAKEPFPKDAIYELTSNIIHRGLMGKEEIISQLEAGNIPIDIDDRDYVKWTSNMPDIAESVLMRLLDIKEDRDIQAQVEDIIKTQCDSAAGKIAVALYAKLVDYDETLLEPILKLNSYYFSMLEDIDIMDVTFKSKQMEVLESIDAKLGKLLDK